MSHGISIIHISDLHFDQSDKKDSDIVVAALLQDINQQRDNGVRFDFILFSGDLVQSGGSTASYAHIASNFARELAAAARVPATHVLFCPGNHDIDRSIVRRDNYVEAGLREILKDRCAINTFIDAHTDISVLESLPPPLLRLESFYKLIWGKERTDRVILNPFLDAYQFDIRGASVGVACFNTAWRTTGEAEGVDYGHLILGERAVDMAA